MLDGDQRRLWQYSGWLLVKGCAQPLQMGMERRICIEGRIIYQLSHSLEVDVKEESLTSFSSTIWSDLVEAHVVHQHRRPRKRKETWVWTEFRIILAWLWSVIFQTAASQYPPASCLKWRKKRAILHSDQFCFDLKTLTVFFWSFFFKLSLRSSSHSIISYLICESFEIIFNYLHSENNISS